MATHTAYYRARYAKNIVKERARKKKYRAAHKAEESAYFKKHHADRPGLRNSWDAKRYAAEKMATPAWANKFFITEAYALSKLREKVCDGKWHVDHVVPLQSRFVCGLHVECNLRVIPSAENQRKNNVFWPDMP